MTCTAEATECRGFAQGNLLDSEASDSASMSDSAQELENEELDAPRQAQPSDYGVKFCGKVCLSEAGCQ